MEVPAAYPRSRPQHAVDRRAWASHVMQPLYGTVGSPMEKGAAISPLGYHAEYRYWS
jgi:hypothetical protein